LKPIFCALLLTISLRSAGADDMVRLPYNHPGLVVDLGVGLWAWPLPMDFDGDGDYDLVVNCPDKPYNGVYFFENTTGDTAKKKMPVFKAGRRISKGMQNVQVSYVGGKPRVLSPGREHIDFCTTGLVKSIPLPLPSKVHPRRTRANMWRYVDFDGDGKTDLVIGVGDWTEYGWDNAYDAKGNWTNGPLHGYVYVARNTGSNEKPAYAKPEKLTAGDKVVDVYGWPSPNVADFDGDGDLDLLCGEFLDGFTYFENTGGRTTPEYSAGVRVEEPPIDRRLTMDLQMITPTAIDWDRDGDQDLICGDEDGRVALIENTGKLAGDGAPLFLPPRYFQQEAADLKCGALATPWCIDWDGDGDQDILCGNTAGYIEYFENLGKAGEERPKWAAPRRLKAAGKTIRIQAGPNGSIQGPCEAKWGYTTLSCADWDGDGLPDVIANSILGKVHWYRNAGTRTAPKLAAAEPIKVAWKGEQPALSYGWMRPDGDALLTQWRTTPVAVDWDRDGLVGLVMLDHEGYLSLFRRKRREGELVLLPPARVFLNEKGEPLRLNPREAGKSGRRKLCVTDWDGDGRTDILVNSGNADLFRQMEERDGHWRFRNMGRVAKRHVAGHTSSPAAADFNADGIADLLCGAEDGHLYYLHNPRVLPGSPRVPGVVIDYSHASLGRYIGSPSIAVLPDGTYVASHDLFGPKANIDKAPATRVFRSTDRGESWTHLSDLRGQFWSTLFVHRDALYILGTAARYNNVVIRRSDDCGRTWTEPKDGKSGLLFEGPYHCAPMPVLEHNGRLWRAMEDNGAGGGWGKHFRSYMLSAPGNADLLDASQWRQSNPVARDASWLDGRFNGWLEGNAVVTPDGKLVNILRVDDPARDKGGEAAVVAVSDDGSRQSFDPKTGFIRFPGANTKFTIRFDPKSRKYWSVANYVPPRHETGNKGSIRNTMALTCSSDLRDWDVRCIIVYRTDTRKHGFQYPDWLFDGDDIIAVSRTAHDDGVGGAHNFHDANYMTFHRIRGFRDLTMKESCAEWSKPPVSLKTAELAVEGHRFSVATFRTDEKAYDNRTYVWKDVPKPFSGWRFTRTLGGVAATITVKAKKDAVVHVATAASQEGTSMSGWEVVPESTFAYTDKGKTKMLVFRKELSAGETLGIPQRNWTGGIVLIPER
jgi:hypothetical protein